MNNQLGQHWILLRGLARESAHWGDFSEQLRAAFPNAEITQLDLPGTGRFYREVSPDSIPAITDHVRAQALTQGVLRRPATILALSLGGMVAWDWLHRYSGEIGGAVLMNTSFAGMSPFYRRLRWQSYREFAALAMIRSRQQREEAILQLVSNRRHRRAQTLSDWQTIQKLRPVALKNCYRQIKAAANFKAGSRKPIQPVLLLNGLGDRLVDPACSSVIGKAYGLKLSSHPWAGHDLSLDDGAWVIVQLEQWLQDLTEADS